MSGDYPQIVQITQMQKMNWPQKCSKGSKEIFDQDWFE